MTMESFSIYSPGPCILCFKTEVLAAIKIVIPVIYTQILVAVCRVYCIISLLILLDVIVIAV